MLAGLPASLTVFRGRLLENLVRKGYEVHVAAPNIFSDETVIEELENLGVVIHEIKMVRAGVNPIKDFRTFFSILRLVNRVRPRTFIAYTAKPVIYGLLASFISNVDQRYALITGLGYGFVGGEGLSRKTVQLLIHNLYRLSLKCATRVFFQNPDDESLFLKKNIIQKSQSRAVLNGSGVDLTFFQKADFIKGPIKFLMIARLLGDKGIREYGRAAKELSQKYSNIEFLLVGDLDDHPDGISGLELDGILGESIHWLGQLKDVRPVIKECHVYVLPSYREGTPRTVLEAMAMGRPIITTDAPGCRETVLDGENGFLIPVQSHIALADAMEKFVQDESLIYNMGSKSYALVKSKYDVKKVNEVFINLMEL